MTHFTDDNFNKEVLESDGVVVVDFWAPWCGPCRAIAPLLEELANEYEGKLKVGKVNVDDNSRSASRYGIMSIPTVMFFKNGNIVEQVVGVVSKAELKRRIESHL